MLKKQTPATSTPEGSAEALPNLDVRVVVFGLRDEQLQVLLTACADTVCDPPGTLDCFELPGSTIPADRSLEETATESMLRISRLRETYLEQLYTYGDIGRHPRKRLISVVYFAIIPAGAALTVPATGDGCAVRWFAVDRLPRMAMDNGEVVAYALRRLRYKLEYSAVGFQLLPEQFSLSELQKMYEIILGERLDKRNFRRRILQAGIIEETEHMRSGEGRPARLYRYRPDAVAEVKARRLFP